MENLLKIAIELHEGEKSTKKIWRFSVDLVQSYTKTQLEEEIECLFPHIKEKGLKLQLYHYDDLAGKVIIDSDVDAVEALNNFIQESLDKRRPMYIPDSSCRRHYSSTCKNYRNCPLLKFIRHKSTKGTFCK